MRQVHAQKHLVAVFKVRVTVRAYKSYILQYDSCSHQLKSGDDFKKSATIYII